jgi:hypothetical protein
MFNVRTSMWKLIKLLSLFNGVITMLENSLPKEKEQIIDAHGDEQSYLQDDGSWRTITSDQYYNETYGSDETI